MTYQHPRLTIPDARIDGRTVTGEFVFSRDVRYELRTETEELFQLQGSTAVIASTVLDLLESGDLDVGEGIRQELSLDIGGGLHVCEIDFTGVDGAGIQWGDTGNGETKTDATGEGVHARMCVLDHYLQRATIDSATPAILEVAEYSETGRYEPLKVVPRNPNAVFDSTESSSVWDGQIAFVETQDLASGTSEQSARGD
jgi:hypothetical protein